MAPPRPARRERAILAGPILSGLAIRFLIVWGSFYFRSPTLHTLVAGA